jgi:16S rRNA (cytosine1402-N4)-methyltransferase
MSARIAKSIVEYRILKTIDTTTALAEIINKSSQFPQVKARIFQAIRIEVNKELENLEKSLQDAIKMLVLG